MIAEAEKIAAESAPSPYERFTVVESENGWAIWDDLHDGYYIDEDDVSEEFTSRWQAEDYLKEVQKSVAEKDAAEWLAVEQAKVIPDTETASREAITSERYVIHQTLGVKAGFVSTFSIGTMSLTGLMLRAIYRLSLQH